MWYNNATNQDCKALQRIVRLAERISGSALPSLQDIYLKCCKSRTAKIIKDSNHPGNHLYILLPVTSGAGPRAVKTGRFFSLSRLCRSSSFCLLFSRLVCSYPQVRRGRPDGPPGGRGGGVERSLEGTPRPAMGVCDEWGGAESRENGARPVELMITNDTCATHWSRVPRRSFGRVK